jgi:hypothetical protein
LALEQANLSYASDYGFTSVKPKMDMNMSRASESPEKNDYSLIVNEFQQELNEKEEHMSVHNQMSTPNI